MTTFSNSISPRRFIVFTAGLLFAIAPCLASAQLLGPEGIPAKEKKSKQRRESVEWLWQYSPPPADGRENELLQDPRFQPLLKKYLTAPQAFWGPQAGVRRSLADTAFDFLAVPGTVSAENDRYLTITGCVFHFCSNRGLLWVDLNAPQPLMAFAAIDWTTENQPPDDPASTYTLWIFTDQALSPQREDSNRIPSALLKSLQQWAAKPPAGSKHRQNITTAVLVDPDGTPHELSSDVLGINGTDTKKKD
ncbi:hypothetical protein [Granulicella sibirica]|uniref:Lipoprotein n=1 Tax=Granulicella sibirica TaxID=2479048 RepID=A0A4Q0SX84_9BACT|nr:hypothetical protein [Granulicella sibirica]RXH55042.1 hypothetical protein GRAN_4146 [Granulicella sibirica]